MKFKTAEENDLLQWDWKYQQNNLISFNPLVVLVDVVMVVQIQTAKQKLPVLSLKYFLISQSRWTKSQIQDTEFTSVGCQIMMIIEFTASQRTFRDMEKTKP